MTGDHIPEGCPMELDCHRDGGYVIWLGRSPGGGWSYVVTPTSAPLGTLGPGPGEDASGGPFCTKALALTRARVRIRQTGFHESQQHSERDVPIPDTTQRRTP
jgi:hypothetical protein